jgi:hypothetical protein
MSRDLYSRVLVQRVISPVAIGTTGTGQTGKVIDRRGYDGVLFAIAYGTITATNATYTVTVKEGDATGTMTSVADTYLRGTEVLAVPTTGTRTSGTTKNVTKQVGYVGVKPYVTVNVKSTVTAGTIVGVDAILGVASQQPVI